MEQVWFCLIISCLLYYIKHSVTFGMNKNVALFVSICTDILLSNKLQKIKPKYMTFSQYLLFLSVWICILLFSWLSIEVLGGVIDSENKACILETCNFFIGCQATNYQLIWNHISERIGKERWLILNFTYTNIYLQLEVCSFSEGSGKLVKNLKA